MASKSFYDVQPPPLSNPGLLIPQKEAPLSSPAPGSPSSPHVCGLALLGRFLDELHAVRPLSLASHGARCALLLFVAERCPACGQTTWCWPSFWWTPGLFPPLALWQEVLGGRSGLDDEGGVPFVASSSSQAALGHGVHQVTPERVPGGDSDAE